MSLGHRRLAIVDLSDAGAQPMVTAGGDGCLIFNGEIYNHADLRKLIPEYQFRGHSDTETLLYLFHKYGPACLNCLNGIFGLGYLDVIRRKLYLARDRFGVKPLYWCGDGRSLAVGSEIRGISAFTGQQVSMESLALLLRHRHVPSPHTLWKDVWKVPPAHFVEVDLDRPELRFQLKPFFGARQVGDDTAAAPAHDAALPDLYAEMVDRAIERQLMADVEVGVFLSGGLDSAITAACMRRHLGPAVRAYTVGYEEMDSADEVGTAQRIAKALGLTHRVVCISERSFAQTFAQVAAIVEEPVAAASMIPLYALARLAAQDVKVVLSGQGADELLGGYTRYQAARAVQLLRHCGIAKPAGAVLSRLCRHGPAHQVAAALSSGGATAPYSALTELFTDAEVGRLLGTKGPCGFEFPSSAAPGNPFPDRSDFANFVMDLDARTSLPDELLMYTDKVTMHFSLECRVPFLDIELAAFLQTLPSSAKVGLSKRKTLQHALLRRWLPGVHLPRRKNGFFVPSTAWFGGRSAVRQDLIGKRSAMADFFDMAEVEKVLRDRDNRMKSDKHVFMLAAIGLWFDRHYRSSPAMVGV